MKYSFNSRNFASLTVTARKTGGAAGFLRLHSDASDDQACYYKYNGFETYILPLTQNTAYTIESSDLHISFAYATPASGLLEQGITCLVFSDRSIEEYGKETMGQAYEGAYRNQFHFSPFTGWMNDPNGLCWFQGYYHLFYQFNPNSTHWENMHWGHSVSKDLIHWTHLPIAAYPQIELLDNPDFRGGAFSGSAAVADDTMHLFYTRHFGKMDRSWQRQWQVTCRSQDGTAFSPEVPCIWGTPEGVFYDFRDPKVTPYGDGWIMVLGGTCRQRPCALWYQSEDLVKWTYRGVLLEETDPLYGICECPDFFFLDGKYVLTAGYIYADRTNADRRDTKYYTGAFDGHRFQVETSGLLDFGKDFYALQTMEHAGRRIAIAWNTTGENIYEEEPGTANGSTGLPRELNLDEGRLISYPVAETELLLGEKLYEGSACAAGAVSAKGPYRMKLSGLDGCRELSCTLARSASEQISLSVRNSQATLTIGNRSVCTFELAEPLSDLTAYVDRSLVELFINRGLCSCTRRFYLTGAEYGIWNLNPGNADAQLEVFQINSIWEKGGDNL